MIDKYFNNAFVRRISVMIVVAVSGLVDAGVVFGADTVDFHYGNGTDLATVGTNTKENYDVAIFLPGSVFTGMKVTALSVPVNGSDDLADFSMWLSTELKLQNIDGKNVNVPDIISMQPVIEGGAALITLKEPVDIGDEGIYAGYSFSVANLTDDSKKPLVVSAPVSDNGLFMRTSKNYRQWSAMGERIGASSCLTVTLLSEMGEIAVNVDHLVDTRALKGEPSELIASISNSGTAPVTKLGYELTVDDTVVSADIQLGNPLMPKLDYFEDITIPLPAINTAGPHDVKVRIVTVDGRDNPSVRNSAEGRVSVLSYAPQHRAMVEEYTGTWCGWCVRGIAAFEYMKANEPDFIGVVIHQTDPMQVMSDFPKDISGLPTSYIDRKTQTDPYFGSRYPEFGLLRDWQEYSEVLAPVDMSVSAQLSGNRVDITTIMKFLEVPQSECRIGYYILKEGVSGSGADWIQHNYYSGQSESADLYIPEMMRFLSGPSVMTDMKYPDVAVAFTPRDGIPGSLDDIRLEETVTHDYSFSSDLVMGDAPVFDPRGELYAVAYVTDTATGQILNAAKCHVEGSSSVTSIPEAEAYETEVSYFDLLGHRIRLPYNGICIRRAVMSDGRTESSVLQYINR